MEGCLAALQIRAGLIWAHSHVWGSFDCHLTCYGLDYHYRLWLGQFHSPAD